MLTPNPAPERQHGGLYPIPSQYGTHRVSPYALVFLPWLTHWGSILSCKQLVVGSNQTVAVDYALGGHPSVLVPSQLLTGSGICGYSSNVSSNTQGKNLDHNGTSAKMPKYSSAFVALLSLFCGLMPMLL